MKRLLCLSFILMILTACQESKQENLATDSYKVKVNAKGVYNGMRAYLKSYPRTQRDRALDTAIVMNEHFILEGAIKTPRFYRITIDGVKGELDIIVAPGITEVEVYKDSIQMSKVTGSELNNSFNLYKNEMAQKGHILKKMRANMSTIDKTDSTAVANFNAQYRALNAEMSGHHFSFIEAHPNAEFSLMFLESIAASQSHTLEDIKKSFLQLQSVASKNDMTKKIATKIQQKIKLREGAENAKIGKVAPDFSAPDPNGKMISLNEIKGKATIIDFWASWCRPCRVENPNVVKVYEKYHDKGLEIISVSLDKKGQKSRWLKAIEDDNLQWHHVSNLKFWNEPVARMYNVSSIPATFILDAEGKIVAKKLRGKALEDKIAELLD